MQRTLGLLSMAVVALFIGHVCAQTEVPQPEWGRITPLGQGRFLIERTVAGAAPMSLPTPFANIVRVHQDDDSPAVLEFNGDASRILIHADHRVTVETAEKSQQFDDGRIIFSALDAVVHGDKAKLESHPGSHRIGFWTNAGDYVTWDYAPTRWGMYDIELTYSAAGANGTRIAVEYASKIFEADLTSTGSWYRYTTIPIGRVYLPDTAKQTLTVRCIKKVGGAVMNLKAVILRPAPEGEQPVRADEHGILTLYPKDATVHGVALRYEPRPDKNTLGFWTKATDAASWDFVIDKPGAYHVMLEHGCGNGQGGSEAAVSIDDRTFKWTVQDTGGYHNFVDLDLGEVQLEGGRHTLIIKSMTKAGAAVMDVHQLQLRPAGP
ncbi:MAG: carbohydrate-binding protein [Planctomycetes bacterium]|nr:carbohydrate-binding protein [Planctomycetota bacterium]